MTDSNYGGGNRRDPFPGLEQPAPQRIVSVPSIVRAPLVGLRFLGGTLVLSYSASVAVDASGANFFLLTATNGTAFTINNPSGLAIGQPFILDLINASGGALGAITLGGNFKPAGAIASPANTKRRTTVFYSPDGTLLIELARAAADI